MIPGGKMINDYVITGMTCQHCVNAVTEEVSALEQVQDVKVQLDGGKMQVTSEGEIDLAELQAAVSEAGDYQVAKA